MHSSLAPLALVAAAGLLPAQQQFKELARHELPPDTDATNDVAAGDVDGDGDVDLVFGNNGQSKIYINQGDGRFVDETATRFPARVLDTRAVLLVDMDRDRDLDVWFANNGQNRLMLNDGTGVFTVATLPTYRPANTDLAVGDVDRDGDLDVYWAEQGVGGTPGQNRLWLNDGNLNFTDVTATHLPPVADGTVAVAMGDLDNDGDLDLVVTNGATLEQDRLYVNDGTGRFSDATNRRPVRQDTSTKALVEDLDRDGDLDILTVGDNGYRELLRNDGNLVFTDVSSGVGNTRGTQQDVVAADLDADGDLDLLIAERSAGRNFILLHDGRLGFVLAPPTRVSQATDESLAAVLVDVDGDLDVDAVIANDSQQNRLELNLHRQIHAPAAPVIGTTYVIDFYSQSGFIAANQPMLAWVGVLPQIPVVTFPNWGALRILLAAAIALPTIDVMPPNGVFSLNVPLVNDRGLIGIPLHIQAAALHSTNPNDWRFTNLVVDTIR